jgi:hypothetical protein
VKEIRGSLFFLNTFLRWLQVPDKGIPGLNEKLVRVFFIFTLFFDSKDYFSFE